MGAHQTARRGRPLRIAVAIGVAIVAALVIALLPAALSGPAAGPGADDAGLPLPATPAPTAPAPSPTQGPGQGQGQGPEQGPERPNIVVVVMDDFSLELLRTMANVVTLQQDAATYDNSFVVNSLCCPSRAATFTGLPPHLNGVLANTSGGPLGALGGYPAFTENGNEERSYNVAVQAAGYRTGFVGKYLNEYEPPLVGGGDRVAPPLIPGWDDFEAVSGAAYQGWGFLATRREGYALELREYPRPDRDVIRKRAVDRTYAGQVIADRALSLLRRYQRNDARAERRGDADGRPWVLHVAPYGTHARTQPSYPDEPLFPAALRDRPSRARPGGNCGLVVCRELSVTDLAGYADPRGDNVPFRLRPNGRVSRADSWRTEPFTLTESRGSTFYRDRARMAQSIDRMIGAMTRQLGRALARDTYLILTSDNGFHLGQHSLNGGKGLPYDSDSRVPLVVAGPGVAPGRRAQFVSNLDLAPTIQALTGTTPTERQAGVSFADTLARPGAEGGRYVFMEHTYGPALPGEPDADLGSGGRLDVIPSYVAVRGERGLLVRVDLDRDFVGQDFAWELYRYDRPWEDVNVFDTDHDLPYARDLRRRLEEWTDCEPRRCARLTR